MADCDRCPECSISPITDVPADFLYQTTDPATNELIGTPDTPVDIPVAQGRSFLITFTPMEPFEPIEVQLRFDCTNTDLAPVIQGVNTLLVKVYVSGSGKWPFSFWKEFRNSYKVYVATDQEPRIVSGQKVAATIDAAEPIPGIEELFALLAARGIPMGVVTTTERRNIDKKLQSLERRNLTHHLQVVIATEDAPRRKPAPEPLLEGARRVGVPAAECVYVGDSHVDIQAGRAAGMKTVGVLTGLDDADTLGREEPTLLLDSVKDLCPFFT